MAVDVTKIPGPYILLNQESAGGVISNDIGSTAPAVVVCFLCFEEPESSVDASATFKIRKPFLIVENDCIQATISNAKSSYLKSASLTLKAGEVFYPNAVHNGDWVMIWMLDDQSKVKEITSALRQTETGRSQLTINGFNSGLKFIGRVSSVSSVDNTAAQGLRTVTQSVQCSAFTEFASSIYFTFLAQGAFSNTAGTASDGNTLARPGVNAQMAIRTVSPPGIADNFAEKFLDTFNNPKEGRSPDAIIEFLLQLVFGMAGNNIDSFDSDGKRITGAGRGTYNNGIFIPQELGKILNKPKSVQKYWQILNVYLGKQEFARKADRSAIANMTQITTNSLGGIYQSPRPCLGSIMFVPPLWSNVEIWSILSQYINPLVNEMFTCLRADVNGNILPTLILRERPFGTGLYNYMGTSVSNQPTISPESKKNDRGMYYTHPRWIADPKIVRNLSVSSSESARVNLIQVWISPNMADLAGAGGGSEISDALLKNNQFVSGNYVADDDDIARHGLRADIQELSNGFDAEQADAARHYAKIRADHLFNGHLMLSGSVVMNGITKPICEGDNFQLHGVVYHIESVNHSYSISNGVKSFTTSLGLSHGILAKSLVKANQRPEYPTKRAFSSINVKNDLPGITDIQQTSHGNREVGGERIPLTKVDGDTGPTDE